MWLLRTVYSFQDSIRSLSSGSMSETPGTGAGTTGTSAPASKPQVLPQAYGPPELVLVPLGINTSFEVVRRHTLMLVYTLPGTLFKVVKPSPKSQSLRRGLVAIPLLPVVATTGAIYWISTKIATAQR
ncbi:hypothetical protein CMUS01_14821 [Colletotrichum musicola]|uniref:Uncharacterized protein n=1 Tax=Colletotrichum musicola TaxID=2175873 RepID=A0A8H6MPU3_9PEZI|nr:hypothetical protein CMUS01_14821 [Colletotrichum musicola]